MYIVQTKHENNNGDTNRIISIAILLVSVGVERASAIETVDSGSNLCRVKPKAIKFGTRSFPARSLELKETVCKLCFHCV